MSIKARLNTAVSSFLKDLLKPKPNTKWDYIVPLSLIGLQFLVMNYGLMNQYIYDPTAGEHVYVKRSLAEIKWHIIFEFFYVVLVIASIVFLTRLQRLFSFIVVFPATGILIIGVSLLIFGVEYVENVYIDIIHTIAILMLFLPFFSLEYILANVALLLKFGNNSKKAKKDDTSIIRTMAAWFACGIGIDYIYLYSINIGGLVGVDITNKFIFEPFYILIGIPPLIPFFAFIFAVIGFIIEKYGQKKKC
ncbi:MAG: hypothetical protein GXO66_09340 [Euryarchaeota archaeon]|nr:hypothetical protein [Euryarchaeota archaeon]